MAKFDPTTRVQRYRELEVRLGTTRTKSRLGQIQAEMENIKKILRGHGFDTDGKRLQALTV